METTVTEERSWTARAVADGDDEPAEPRPPLLRRLRAVPARLRDLDRAAERRVRRR